VLILQPGLLEPGLEFNTIVGITFSTVKGGFYTRKLLGASVLDCHGSLHLGSTIAH
jgi:hypothetical protein